MVATEPSDKTIFTLPLGYGVIVFGLVAFTLGTFGSWLGLTVGDGVRWAVLAGVVVGVLQYHELAKAYKARWHAANNMFMARLRRDAAELEAQADAFGRSNTTEADDTAGITADDDDANRLRVNTAHGSYTVSRLTTDEANEMALIGDCLKFLAIGKRAGGKYSLRKMQPHRQVGWSETKFEKWWTRVSNQLVTWRLFEKGERDTTKPVGSLTSEDVRRALLRREFHTIEPTALRPAQTGQGQTV